MEEILEIDREHFEAPVVTKYEEGGAFAPHNDASGDLGREWDDCGGQRIATAIIALKDCQFGGETKFSNLDLKVAAKRGRGLFFFPADAETLQADERTLHEGVKVGKGGSKYITQIFIRKNPVPPPLGLPLVK